MSAINGIIHIGVAVENGKSTAEFYQKYLGGEILSRMEFPEMEQVSTMVRIGACELELIEPTNENGVIGKYLSKKGPGLHHFSIEVEGIHNLADELEAEGIQVIGKNFDDPDVHFMFISPKSTGGVLIELVEHFKASDKKCGVACDAPEKSL